MNAATAYAAVMAADHLPSPSSVALDLVALTRDPDAEVDDVARLVGMDPAICARVLRTVNAASTGTRHAVTSVPQAVSRLGMRAVGRLAVEVSVLERNRSGLAEFDYGAFWAESLARAVAARLLAGTTGQVPADDAFTYGLLSGIGRLALVSVYPAQYRELLLTLGGLDPVELAEAERAVFDVDAETLSALMLKGWGMPAYHDAMTRGQAEPAPTPSCEQALLQTCRAAGLVARVMIGAVVTRDQVGASLQAMAAIGLDAEAVARLFPDIVDSLHALGAQLHVTTNAARSLTDVYTHAIDGP